MAASLWGGRLERGGDFARMDEDRKWEASMVLARHTILQHGVRGLFLVGCGGFVACSAATDSREQIAFTKQAADIGPAYHFGVRCQDDFQNGWNATIDTYGQCDNFISDMINAGETEDFYFNLHGAAVGFTSGNPNETCLSCGGADSTQIFYLNTHGGVFGSNSAGYSMWDSGSNAYVQNMVLGSKLDAFLTYACDTLQTSDGNFWTRWSNAFSGGLLSLNGAHDLVYSGVSDIGADVADSMAYDGSAIGWSWIYNVYMDDNSNHPSTANTGANSTDCWNRQGVTLTNLYDTPKLGSGSIGYVCWSGYNGE
jgi:hypothetical protein